ncbi:MAG: IPT/TIG domain-containing protein [Candidatus Paceibacterota bacterium]|jgi:hypothetical protein
MSKENMKNLIKTFGLVGIVVFSSVFFLIPKTSDARTYTYYQPAPFGNTTQNDYEDNSQNYLDNNPLPYITSITPNSVTIQSQIIKITINGSGFMKSSTVHFDGNPRTVTYINSTKLVIQLNENDISKAGRYYITVINDAPGGGYSNPISFIVSKPATTTQSNSTNNSAYSASAITAYENTFEDSQNENITSQSYKNLTANAIFGSKGFLPTGIFQWILFIIILLVIVFVWRKFFGGEAKYSSTPLKHA